MQMKQNVQRALSPQPISWIERGVVRQQVSPARTTVCVIATRARASTKLVVLQFYLTKKPRAFRAASGSNAGSEIGRSRSSNAARGTHRLRQRRPQLEA